MSRPWRRAGAVERIIDAPAEQVYRVVTDVTSTGERSDECQRVEWLPGSPNDAVVGARFRGHNRSGMSRWSRVCEIIEAVPDQKFAFRTVPERLDPSRRDSTIWRYELSSDGDRTLVRHSYEIVVQPLQPFRWLFGRLLPHHRDMRPAMHHTLEALDRSFAGTALQDGPRHT